MSPVKWLGVFVTVLCSCVISLASYLESEPQDTWHHSASRFTFFISKNKDTEMMCTWDHIWKWEQLWVVVPLGPHGCRCVFASIYGSQSFYLHVHFFLNRSLSHSLLMNSALYRCIRAAVTYTLTSECSGNT